MLCACCDECGLAACGPTAAERQEHIGGTGVHEKQEVIGNMPFSIS